MKANLTKTFGRWKKPPESGLQEQKHTEVDAALLHQHGQVPHRTLKRLTQHIYNMPI
jgi:hypothetical protein